MDILGLIVGIFFVFIAIIIAAFWETIRKHVSEFLENLRKIIKSFYRKRKLDYKIAFAEKDLTDAIQSKDYQAISYQIKLFKQYLIEAADDKYIVKIKRIFNILLSQLNKVNDDVHVNISLEIESFLIDFSDDPQITKIGLNVIFGWFAKYETDNMEDFEKFNLRCEHIFLRSCLLIIGKYSNKKEEFREKLQEYGEYLIYNYQDTFNPLMEFNLDIQYISVLWQIAAKTYSLGIHPIDEHLIDLIKSKTSKNEKGYDEAVNGYIPLIPLYNWPPDYRLLDPHFTKFPLSNREELQNLRNHIWPRTI